MPGMLNIMIALKGFHKYLNHWDFIGYEE